MAMFAQLVSSFLDALVMSAFFGMIAAWVWLLGRLRTGPLRLAPPVVRIVPWGGGAVAAALCAWFVLNFAIVAIYTLVSGRPRKVPFVFSEQMLLVGIVNASTLVVLPLLLRVLSGARLKDLGLDRAQIAEPARFGALAFLVVTVPINTLFVLCGMIWKPAKHPLEEMVRTGLSPGTAYLAVISAVVLAPAAEELVFRGILQSWLARVFQRWQARPREVTDALERDDLLAGDEAPDGKPRRWDWPSFLPILLTSFLFGLVHWPQWPAPIPIFALSLALGLIYQRTGSLVASFVLHALFNGFSTAILFWVLSHPQVTNLKKVPPPATQVENSLSVIARTVGPPAKQPFFKFMIGVYFSVGATGGN